VIFANIGTHADRCVPDDDLDHRSTSIVTAAGYDRFLTPLYGA
jgi:hypothetical protein